MKLNTTKFKNRKWFYIKHDCSKENKWLWSTRTIAFGLLTGTPWQTHLISHLLISKTQILQTALFQSSRNEQKKKKKKANLCKYHKNPANFLCVKKSLAVSLDIIQSWGEGNLCGNLQKVEDLGGPTIKCFIYYYYVFRFMVLASSCSKLPNEPLSHVRRSESRMLLEPPSLLQNKKRWFIWCRHRIGSAGLQFFSMKSCLQNWVGRWLRIFLFLWKPGLGSCWRWHADWSWVVLRKFCVNSIAHRKVAENTAHLSVI